VVKLPGIGLPTAPAFLRQAHPISGFRDLENAGSMIPYIKNNHFSEILGNKMNPNNKHDVKIQNYKRSV
jgi:hypothetical protein